jgi:hypothetical protein
LKFDKTIKEFGFKENVEDNCVYAKFKNGKYIFLFLYVDDILLASSDVSLLRGTKSFLSSHFEMKDLGEAKFILGIEIHRDRNKGVLGLSQKQYIEKVLKKYSMHRCSASPAPIVKGDRYGEFQCPKNQYEIEQMKRVSYASAVGSLQYAQVRTRPDLAFVTGLLDRFQSNPGPEHWKLIKKVLHYLQGIKGLMLTYRKQNLCISWDTQTPIMQEMTENPCLGMCSPSQGEQYRGRVANKPSLHRPQCMPSLLHVMRPQGR